ncbi:leucyl/phenylalanyl-tRNA--protein transferase [Ottowia thiooxydans]|uniref:leucyl/phenylalanyl-tRNA--protein transferase n=1 Tax=Ottowia thiooxydans TaxID=219182 RepID=UPI0004051BAB|nr:leucyl/phenylalanyl-tRNA--protein transferase [Ottowia thiooxydans]
MLSPGEPFPPLQQAWPAHSAAPGLLATGGILDVPTLLAAYSATIFPWFSEGEPILWWSPDPRMVLDVSCFRLHRSMRKTLQRFRMSAHCEIRIDTAFDSVISSCAGIQRADQAGTWIVPDMVAAYRNLHAAGYAHSVETWVEGRLVAGLYCVAIGRAVFGESMFTTVSDGSKIALAALVAFCREHAIAFIDCQQATRHLASLGANPMPRLQFAERVQEQLPKPPPRWQFDPVYWNTLMPPSTFDR